MLFTEAQLQPRGLDLLDEAVYLTEEEVIVKPQTVPILESSNLQAYHIPYYAIEALAESNGYSLRDAILEVCAVDEIDPFKVAVSISEDEAILNPEVVQELDNVVIAPISHMDPIYHLCEAVIDEYADSLDNALLESLFNSDMSHGSILKAMQQANIDITNRHRLAALKVHSSSELDRVNAKYEKELQDVSKEAQDAIKRGRDKRLAQRQQQASQSNNSILGSLVSNNQNKQNSNGGMVSAVGHEVVDALGKGIAKMLGVTALGTTAAIGGGILAYKHYQNKPKSVIAKKIASLRKLYAKTMHRFQNASDNGIKNKLKHVAGKILEMIDKLLGFLQRKADHR